MESFGIAHCISVLSASAENRFQFVQNKVYCGLWLRCGWAVGRGVFPLANHFVSIHLFLLVIFLLRVCGDDCEGASLHMSDSFHGLVAICSKLPNDANLEKYTRFFLQMY